MFSLWSLFTHPYLRHPHSPTPPDVLYPYSSLSRAQCGPHYWSFKKCLCYATFKRSHSTALTLTPTLPLHGAHNLPQLMVFFFRFFPSLNSCTISFKIPIRTCVIACCTPLPRAILLCTKYHRPFILYSTVE